MYRPEVVLRASYESHYPENVIWPCPTLAEVRRANPWPLWREGDEIGDVTGTGINTSLSTTGSIAFVEASPDAAKHNRMLIIYVALSFDLRLTR